MTLRQRKLDDTKVPLSNHWYREQVRVKQMLHEFGRLMEEMRLEKEEVEK